MTYKILLFIVLLILSPFLIPVGVSLYEYADPKQAIDYKVFRVTRPPKDLHTTSEEMHVMSSFRGYMKFLVNDISITQHFGDTFTVYQRKTYSQYPPSCRSSLYDGFCSEKMSPHKQHYIHSIGADKQSEEIELTINDTGIQIYAHNTSLSQAEWEQIIDSLQAINPGGFKVFYHEPPSI
jgi:hypothetical protein